MYMYAFIKHLSLIFNNIYQNLKKNQMLSPDVHTAGIRVQYRALNICIIVMATDHSSIMNTSSVQP